MKTTTPYFKLFILAILMGIAPIMAIGNTIGVFFNKTIPQHEFAANDIKTALESKNFNVEIKDLTELTDSYKGKKVVISLASDNDVLELLKSQGGSDVKKMGEQAYALQTSKSPDLSYWVLGGDDNGAMYGGLDLAEKINANGLKGNYNKTNTPYVKKRGIKFNIPLDKNAPTYEYSNGGTSHKNAI